MGELRGHAAAERETEIVTVVPAVVDVQGDHRAQSNSEEGAVAEAKRGFQSNFEWELLIYSSSSVAWTYRKPYSMYPSSARFAQTSSA